MYGLIVEITALEGQADRLAQLLDKAFSGQLGMLSHIVSGDASNPDKLWITEYWDCKESHAAALSSEQVLNGMETARPLIAKRGQRVETIPLAGID